MAAISNSVNGSPTSSQIAPPPYNSNNPSPELTKKVDGIFIKLQMGSIVRVNDLQSIEVGTQKETESSSILIPFLEVTYLNGLSKRYLYPPVYQDNYDLATKAAKKVLESDCNRLEEALTFFDKKS